MASSPYILTSVHEALVYSGIAPDPEFEGEEAPTGRRVVIELNDGEAIAQLFLDPDGARELSRRLLVVATEVEGAVALDRETQEQLIDLLMLVAAGSTAKTLASRAAAILPHLKGAGHVA